MTKQMGGRILYKLLALDMDGTLLNSQKMITEKVKASIEYLLHKDIHVTIATGRFPASVWLHGKELGLVSQLIALNGAIILDSTNGEAIEETPILEKDVLEIIKFAQRHNVYVHFYGYNKLYVEKRNSMNDKWFMGNVVIDEKKQAKIQDYEEQLSLFQLVEVGDFLHFFPDLVDSPLFKATIIDSNLQKVEKLYQEMIKWTGLSVTRTGKRRFDINDKKVSKKNALNKVCNNLNIKNEEVIAVGDYDNDSEMIEWAGKGVAMGNSNNFIKNIADDITLSNEEDGVALLINKYFSFEESRKK